MTVTCFTEEGKGGSMTPSKSWDRKDRADKFSLSLLLLLLLCRFSRVRLCATPETAAHQASPSLGFSRQEHWSGLPFPSPMHESESEVAQLCPTLRDPHGLQPTRLLCPWNFPGKSTGVGCHCLLRVPPRLANEASRKTSALCMAKNKLPETSSSSITAAIYSVSSFSVV